MTSGNSDPEMYITQSSPQQERSFPFDDLCHDTTVSDEDIWAGEIEGVEEQSSVMGFDRFFHSISETKVRAQIYDCLPESARCKDK